MHAVFIPLQCFLCIGLASRVYRLHTEDFRNNNDAIQQGHVEADATRALASYMFAGNAPIRARNNGLGLAVRRNAFNPARFSERQNRLSGVDESKSRSRPPVMQWWDPSTWGQKQVSEISEGTSAPTKPPGLRTAFRSKEALKLKALGGSPADKALQVNLDPLTYGSFAEIGAGQEVSRTFLQAGAAAGTVAKSLSAYDMQMSDALYGSAKRYVTKERCVQMMDGEYKDLEAYVREGKAAWGGRKPEVRFFSFAATLAAKAYMSDRECEGWVGVTYQHEAGAEKSTILLHVRMSDPTAPLQGEAIGVLGTNLIYLCTNTNDPYVITSFLQDGIEEGRLEIDYLEFDGPAFPASSIDYRLLALRQVQFGLTPSVMLEMSPQTGKYVQVVPNDALYKTPIIVQRSRFVPVTNTHEEVMASAKRQVLASAAEGDKQPKCINQLQIDDLMLPESVGSTDARMDNIASLVRADGDGDGFLSLDELRGVLAKRSKLSAEEVDKLVSSMDYEETGFVAIDSLAVLSDRGPAAVAFLDRLEMLQALGNPVLVSSIVQTHTIAEYLARYTNQQVTVAVGGGNYSIQRGLFNAKKYVDLSGGVLEAFGRLFSKKVKIFEYPHIEIDGSVTPAIIPSGADNLLHQYLVEQGHLVPIAEEHMSASAKDSSSNKAFAGGAGEIRDSIRAGTSDWETYVPKEVADIAKQRKWFKQVQEGLSPVGDFYEVLEKISS